MSDSRIEEEDAGLRLEDIVIIFTLISFVLAVGTLGFFYTTHLALLDSFYNASMILSGVGPIAKIYSTSGKYFSSFFALFGTFVFIVIITLLIQRLVILDARISRI
jgi:hypothetical protein